MLNHNTVLLLGIIFPPCTISIPIIDLHHAAGNHSDLDLAIEAAQNSSIITNETITTIVANDEEAFCSKSGSVCGYAYPTSLKFVCAPGSLPGVFPPEDGCPNGTRCIPAECEFYDDRQFACSPNSETGGLPRRIMRCELFDDEQKDQNEISNVLVGDENDGEVISRKVVKRSDADSQVKAPSTAAKRDRNGSDDKCEPGDLCGYAYEDHFVGLCREDGLIGVKEMNGDGCPGGTQCIPSHPDPLDPARLTMYCNLINAHIVDN